MGRELINIWSSDSVVVIGVLSDSAPRRSWIMRPMQRCALVVMSLAFTFGCATGRVAYEKPGGTETDRKRDVSECVQASIGHEPGRHVFAPVVLDREAFAKCLESRGYSQLP